MTTPEKTPARPGRSEEQQTAPLIAVAIYAVLMAAVASLIFKYHYSLRWLFNLMLVGVGGIVIWGVRWLLDAGARRMAGGLARLTPNEHNELTPKDRLELANTAKQTFLQGATVLAVVVGAIFTGGGLFYTGQTLETTQQGQITDRYTRAIDQLGSTKIDVRLGGIYALDRLAHDSPSDKRTITNVLAAYIREHARSAPTTRPDSSTPYKVATDVDAAVTVLGSLGMDPIDQYVNLHGARIPEFDLSKITGQDADFSDADLRLASFDGGDEKLLMSAADFSHTNLQQAGFSNADINAGFFNHANLRDATLDHVNLKSAQFAKADLREAFLQNAILVIARFGKADLRNIQMEDVDLERAYLVGTDLRGASLDRVNLTKADLWHADLRGVDLRKTEGLTRAQISKAKTDGKTGLPPGLR